MSQSGDLESGPGSFSRASCLGTGACRLGLDVLGSTHSISVAAAVISEINVFQHLFWECSFRQDARVCSFLLLLYKRV
jgi:hypothetical protein